MLMGALEMKRIACSCRKQVRNMHGNVSLAVKSMPVFSKYFNMRDEYLT